MVTTSTKNVMMHQSEKGPVVNSDLFYRSLFQYNPDSVIFMDVYGIIAKMNRGFSETLGYNQNEIKLRSLDQFLPPSEVSTYKEIFNKVLTGETQYTYMTFLHKDGKEIYINLNLIPARSKGRVIGVFGIVKDITHIKESEAMLAESELKFSSIVNDALIGVYIVQEDGKISYGNKKFYEMLGIADCETEVIFRNYVHPEDIDRLNSLGQSLINGGEGMTHYHRIIQKDGSVIEVESHSAKIQLHHKSHIVGSLQDITEQKRIAELNEYLAYHDHLTGLPNHRLFYKRMDEEIILSNALQQPLTVMLIDLDRFKYVNDSLGHPIGNKLLKEVSQRLRMCLRDEDLLSRDGGDEFSIILPNTGRTNEVIEYAKTMIESLEKPFYIEEYELFVTASIGISIYPNDGEDAETLIKHADSALYKAKTKGKNTYQIFTSSMNTETYKIFSLESDLRKALELNQLELNYQPQICSNTNEIIGVEALIRWDHPEWGMVYPNEFIPIAEETGFIKEIGKWIKETACVQIKTWQDIGLPKIPISINVSAHRFLEKNFLTNIKETLAKTKLDPKYLQIEIVETYILENEKAVFSVLEELKEMGVKVFLDDFGTGYSSLSYLERFKGKIDTLKIDRSFISGLSRSDEQNSNFLTKTIIDLARHFNMGVIAEGVETVEHLEILKEYNCNSIQGYLFSKPVPAEEFALLLKKGKIELPQSNHQAIRTEERRRFFRMDLDMPLLASMTPIKVHGRTVELGKTGVLIENIGLGGLCFLSDIRLPSRKDILLEFETEMLGQTVKMHGYIVWMKELKFDIYQYGLEFAIDENERTVIVQLINRLAILLKRNSKVPDSSFIDVEPYTFFKQKNGR